MWRWLRRLGRRCPVSSGPVEVGWLLDAERSSVIWEAPRPFQRTLGPAPSAKAVQRCPAIMDYESRFIEVLCPFDLHLRFLPQPDGGVRLQNVAGDMSAIAKSKLSEVIVLMAKNRWRYPDKPVLQIHTPYRFVSDAMVYLEQLPPFLTYADPPLPGVVIGGRIPIHIWPRLLMWAFEWHDVKQDLILKRGMPWFTVRFETLQPALPIKLVAAEMTPEVTRYCRSIDGVTSYVNHTFSLFKIAHARRPRRLLIKTNN